MYELIVEADFAAAHSLRGYQGECENLHGHNWKVQVMLKAEALDGLGMVMDFKEIKRTLGEILEGLDHKHLNELTLFKKENPTTENVSRILYHELSKRLPQRVSVSKVTTWESAYCGASYFQ
ncbi:MAG TPA: 6-carboxytetrahydropterin synthase QueD [Candidatus Tripitaka californicus]|uniref:6-carboxytetrahydropterin synthase QueD n=1 Tax=Candidatus Tripitaka californicus TaxID=3367616 RepID=UPI0040280CA8|nr:6-carboxytetrahydropterin synthase QueD [Planctomycetota bacterium]